ncbi:MAG: PAS domain-containing protein [Acidobacteriota bacterium]|nr:PAS domain-containing protein [Acidobacteriota bacterium]
MHPDDLDEFLERWRNAIRTGETFRSESRVRRADGQFRWMLHHGITLRTPQGSVLRWFGSSIDIDARKQAEAELQAALAENQSSQGPALQREHRASRTDRQNLFVRRNRRLVTRTEHGTCKGRQGRPY